MSMPVMALDRSSLLTWVRTMGKMNSPMNSAKSSSPRFALSCSREFPNRVDSWGCGGAWAGSPDAGIPGWPWNPPLGIDPGGPPLKGPEGIPLGGPPLGIPRGAPRPQIM